MALLVALITFVLILASFLAVALLGRRRAQEAVIAQRLEEIEEARRRGNVNPELALMRDELLSSLPWFHRLLLRWSGASRLQDLIYQAGLKIRAGKLMLVCGVKGLGAFVVLDTFGVRPLLAALVGLLALGFPLALVAWKRNRRLRQFERQFPEAVDLLSRAMRAGHAFSAGLEMAGSELADPLAGEFRKVFDEQNFGLPMREALLNLLDRVPLVDVRFFVTAVLIQKDTGGNLTEILDNLARAIRERYKILGEVRVRTAQGRLTAGILIALPLLILAALRVLNPEYINLLFDDPMGPPMLIAGAALQVIGSLVLWKIVHIQV